MKRKRFSISSSLFAYSIVVIQSTKDDEITLSQEDSTGQIALSLSVVPSDFKDVQGTFITISDIKFDEEKANGFVKQTIELSAYQDGDVKFLFNGKVEAKTYNSVTFVLDYESDALGNFPGCYVLTDDNRKHCLRPGKETRCEITLTKKFMIEPESPAEVVIGLDLRKSIITGGLNKDYRFVSEADLYKAFRIVSKEECGEVKGNVSKAFGLSNDLYVFVYRKGEFNILTETSGQGSNNILFDKAVTSSKVKAYGSYELSLIEEGDYEIHIATYDKDSSDLFLFKGIANSSSNIHSFLLNHIPVSAKSQIQLNIDILGVM